MRMRAPAALLAAGVLRTGCTGDDVGLPGPAKVDVDTPELRQMKQGPHGDRVGSSASTTRTRR